MTIRKWTEQDAQAIAKYYARLPVSMLAVALDRTPSEIRNKAAHMGLTRGNYKHWTQAEIDLLRRDYGRRSVYRLAAIMDRTPASVMRRACDLGFSGRTRKAA